MAMTRADVKAKVMEKKRVLGLKWSAIAEALGPGSPMFYTAALLGHQALTADEARKAGALLELDDASAGMLAESPEERGASLKMPPSDPLLYRFLRNCAGVWATLKALINDEFGDGIMSAIDFRMQLEREPDPKGNRVRITMSGKFVPYKRF